MDGVRRRLTLFATVMVPVVALATLTAVLAGAPAVSAAKGAAGRIAALGASTPSVPQQITATEFGRMRRIGMNHASLDVWWEFDTIHSNSLHPGPHTTLDADLGIAIDGARRAGLDVILTPKIFCPRCAHTDGFTWRGRLKPSDPAAFFRAYGQMVDHYADMARAHGVSLFFIGSEMSGVQSDAGQWRQIARQARDHFGGRIAYEVNWDVLDKVPFWDAVDVVGLSAYFPLSDAAKPSVDDLKAAWHSSGAAQFRDHRWFDAVEALARTTGKQVLFGEAGYPSRLGGASTPYDPGHGGAADQQVQVNAYQALLETFQSQPWWAGVVWWEWIVPGGVINDTSFSPRNKMAEAFLSSWYGA